MSAHAPIRTCAGCRKRLPVATLVRLSASATDGICVTGVLGGRKTGRKALKHRDRFARGLYTCPNLQCASRALRPIRGRLKLTATVDSLVEQVLYEAASQVRWRFERRKNGLARRGLDVQDARLRAWSETLARLNAVAPTALDSGVE